MIKYLIGWNFNQFPVTACDVNGDGADDLVGFGSASNLIFYFRNFYILKLKP